MLEPPVGLETVGIAGVAIYGLKLAYDVVHNRRNGRGGSNGQLRCFDHEQRISSLEGQIRAELHHIREDIKALGEELKTRRE